MPWDSYIIKNKVGFSPSNPWTLQLRRTRSQAWTYAPWAVTYTVFRVPVEEVFFFVIQSLLTCHLHLLLSLPILPPLFVSPLRDDDLSVTRANVWILLRWGPTIILADLARRGWSSAVPATHPFYLSCIAFWALPVVAFLWTMGGDYVLRRPWAATLLALALPTLYLCVVDIIALRAGTWRIERPTSLGIFVVPDLPLEEAVFFFVTNCLLVFGMSTFEKAYAILDLWPELAKSKGPSEEQSSLVLPAFSLRYFTSLVRGLRANRSKLSLSRRARVKALLSTQQLLSEASKSFSVASFFIPHGGGAGSRADLIVLYAWCRATDNMIDHAESEEDAKAAVSVCTEFLDLLWGKKGTGGANGHLQNGAANGSASHATSSSIGHTFPSDHEINRFLGTRLPPKYQPAFLLLASLQHQLRLPRYPFDKLLDGYLWDASHSSRPVQTEECMLEYARLVAGSVGEMCVLALRAREGLSTSHDAEGDLEGVCAAAREAGVCLQLVNIARDIREDASRGRCYLPREWLEGPAALPQTLDASSADDLPMASLALRVLGLASAHFDGPRFEAAIASLPSGCRAGVRAAIVAYLEIGEEVARGARSGTWKGERVSVTAGRRAWAVIKEIWRPPVLFGAGPWAHRKRLFDFPVAQATLDGRAKAQ